MRLILVRHGQTTSNVHGLLDTADPGADLTELGRQQAGALPVALAGQGVDVVVASPLVRARQTAAPLATALDLPVEVRDGVREIRAGELEMRGDPASVDAYLRTAFAWSAGDLDRRMPGGEDGHEVYARYDAVLAELAGSGVSTAVVVSHGAVIRSWCAAHAGVSVAHAEQQGLSNTGAVVVEGGPGRWRALHWEDVPLAGPALDDDAHEGPTGEPFDPGPSPARTDPRA